MQWRLSIYNGTQSALKQNLLQSILASKEDCINSANTYDDKDQGLFQNWLDYMSCLPSNSGTTQDEIAVSNSKVSLQKFVQSGSL